ncbi:MULTISPECIES: long-chain fatty acid--CoA ligase [Streptomyces]|uniref:Acyl-CoA synthetase n=1 Tax=Streptomyces lycii TaxID=2654337 RepID=A0ABQ7FNL4_9ACTN|nr:MULTISPECIES: AMP-dependent synthetase/ligase [Streptomyces]KAF4409219.1 long-chain fatty acid--CoA ligase [Streptomyces lycii]PGH51214.1 long-chain fatty acid--CoA ligase [Streptomyces sp. Ru87]
MRELSLPPLVQTLRSGGLADSVFEAADTDPDLVQFSRGEEGPEGMRWLPVTAQGFRTEVLALAKGLIAEGLRPGDRVAVMSRTRYEWTQFCYAIWSVGAQLVPVYPTSSAEQVHWILAGTRAVAVVVEGEDDAMTVGAVCDGLPGLRKIWQLDDDCVPELVELGRGVPEMMVHRYRATVRPGSAATITYTSGTTGRPKGCVITHANLAFECDTLITGWRELLAPPGEQPSVLAYLPLAHVYGLMVQVSCQRHGIRLGHQPSSSTEDVLRGLASFRPSFLLAVPHMFEKIFRQARRTAEEHGRLEVFDKAVDTAMRYAEAKERRYLGLGPGPSPSLRAQHTLYDRPVYRQLRDVFGGRVRHAVSGGSPLSRELGLLFAGAGITVYDGYGLTETSAAVTGHPLGRPRFGTVGRPLPGCAVHIAPDGEIWVRGPNVFAGYLDDRAGTEEVLRDGWLATGDLGHLDDEGYLRLTGRKKDIIITSSGKSVSPHVLEQRLRCHPLISQCMLVGDNRPFVSALITLDREALVHWRRLHYKELMDTRAAAQDADLQEEIQRAVSRANTAVSRSESIRAFVILPDEFTVAEGLLTPSLKLRRGAVVKAYATEIASLYQP